MLGRLISCIHRQETMSNLRARRPASKFKYPNPISPNDNPCRSIFRFGSRELNGLHARPSRIPNPKECGRIGGFAMLTTRG